MRTETLLARRENVPKQQKADIDVRAYESIFELRFSFDENTVSDFGTSWWKLLYEELVVTYGFRGRSAQVWASRERGEAA